MRSDWRNGARERPVGRRRCFLEGVSFRRIDPASRHPLPEEPHVRSQRHRSTRDRGTVSARRNQDSFENCRRYPANVMASCLLRKHFIGHLEWRCAGPGFVPSRFMARLHSGRHLADSSETPGSENHHDAGSLRVRGRRQPPVFRDSSRPCTKRTGMAVGTFYTVDRNSKFRTNGRPEFVGRRLAEIRSPNEKPLTISGRAL